MLEYTGRTKHFHTVTRPHRKLRKNGTTSIIPNTSPRCFVPSRWSSTEFGELADAVEESKRPLGEKSNQEEANGDRIPFDKDLIRKYSHLELWKFLGVLSRHKQNVLRSHTRREDGGSRALKDFMRSMPHSTALITTLANEKVLPTQSLKKAKNLSPYAEHFRGAVVSSLTSVTLGPPAIISFNFKQPSATLDGILANRFFTVHFLKSTTEGAAVAMHFLRHPGDHFASWRALSQNHEITVCKRVNHGVSQPKVPQHPVAPIIKGAGVVAHLVCEVLPEKCVFGIGDHSILVAKVVNGPAHTRPDEKKSPNDLRKGVPPLLLYSQGVFREHGNHLPVEAEAGSNPGKEVEIAKDTERFHVDLHLRRQVIQADEPILYKAATSYIDSILLRHSNSDYADTLRKFSQLMEGSTDRRARFVAALKFWQFELATATKAQPDLAKLRISQFVNSGVGPAGIAAYDGRLKAIAEEFVRLSVTETMGQAAAEDIAQKFREGEAQEQEQGQEGGMEKSQSVSLLKPKRSRLTRSVSLNSLQEAPEVDREVMKKGEPLDYASISESLRDIQDGLDDYMKDLNIGEGE